MSKKVINKIEVVSSEKNLSSKWFMEQLNKIETLVFRSYTNNVQSLIKTFVQISELLEVKLTSLFNE